MNQATDNAIIAQPASPPVKRGRGRPKGVSGTPTLKTIQSVRLALAECLRDLRANKIESRVAGVLIYGYSKLAELLKDQSLEEMQRRLEKLEREGNAIPINAPREKTG